MRLYLFKRVIMNYHAFFFLFFFSCLLSQEHWQVAGDIISAGLVITQSISNGKINNASSIAGYEIAHPGYYILTNDILYKPQSSGTACILISHDNVVLDLNTHVISEVGESSKGLSSYAIKISPGVKNVTIKNGGIKDFYGGAFHIYGSSENVISDIHIERMSIAATSCDEDSAICYLGYARNVFIKNTSFSNNENFTKGSVFKGNSLKALKMSFVLFSGNKNFSTGIDIKNSTTSFFNTVSISSFESDLHENFIGLTLSGCSESQFLNISIENNAGTYKSLQSCYGFNLINSSNNVFDNCSVKGNVAIKSNIGFNLYQNTGSNLFKQCEVAGLQGLQEDGSSTVNDIQIVGFYLDSSFANIFERSLVRNCYSYIGNGLLAGFLFCNQSNSNQIQSCRVLGQNALIFDPSAHLSGQCIGFYSYGNSWNTFKECEATFNRDKGIVGSNVKAYGFLLAFEKGSSIFNSVANGNHAYGGSCGYYLDNVISCSIIRSSASDNKYDGGVPGRSFGFYDATIPSKTFFQANTSFGHGGVFAGTTGNDPATVDMNYYLALTSENLMNMIKEVHATDLNAIAESGGKDLFNWSVIYEE